MLVTLKNVCSVSGLAKTTRRHFQTLVDGEFPPKTWTDTDATENSVFVLFHPRCVFALKSVLCVGL